MLLVHLKSDQVHLDVSFINDIIKIIDAYPPAISLKKPGEDTNMFNWEKKWAKNKSDW